MLDNYLLEELTTFARTGTLAKTAAQLNVTQPTVTRGMQKLEADWGVRLFDRQPNRITLTPTGKLAAQEAAALLQAQHQAIKKVQNFERSQHHLTIGSTLPGPLMLLQHLRPQLPVQTTITADLLTDQDLTQKLQDRDYTLILTSQAPTAPDITTQFLGTENLAVNLNQFMYQANQADIRFAELKDLSFLVIADIGPWRDIIQRAIPGAKFLYQDQREAFREISAYTDFPYFNSNFSFLDPLLTTNTSKTNTVRLPIRDQSAHMPVYAAYLPTNQTVVAPMIRLLRENWPATA
ncbi:LysR family transcriptional regulator [Levilactobacillus sp. HBUAS70063]|uniref:LysR family transcriptional regulator n=1 Tax=Levilactobacillus sp. HBUAS70063 TaxID=3109359 RepID=UPI003132F7E7